MRYTPCSTRTCASWYTDPVIQRAVASKATWADTPVAVSIAGSSAGNSYFTRGGSPFLVKCVEIKIKMR